MSLYLWNVILLLIEYHLLLKYKLDKKYGLKIFVILAVTQWVIISGFRDLQIGADTISYYDSFERVKLRSWSSIWDDVVLAYFHNVEIKDPGYSLFVKVFQVFSNNYRIYLIFIALLFTVPMGFFIYNNSKNAFLSFLLYSSLFYSFFAITGIRQTVSTALIVFFGFYFIKKRKLFPFLILALLAFVIHKSSIVFVPYYFISQKKITKNYLIIIVLIIPFLFVFRGAFLEALQYIIGYDSYTIYEGAGAWTFTFLFIVVFIAIIWRSKEILNNNKDAKYVINAIILALIFLPLTFINPAMMRVVQYFSLFLMIILPEIVDSFRDREKVIAEYACYAVLILLLAEKNPHYLFMGQQ